VSNNKPFVKSTLLRYKSHNTISIPKQFIRNNVQQGECLTKSTDLDMTKHSDYFVWKDTSERVARSCDYTVDKKRVNSCVLKHLFLEGVEQPQIPPKKSGSELFDALLMSRFQNIATDAAKQKTALHAIFWNRASRGFN